MIGEFSECYDLDLYFDASKISPRLDWMQARNRKALGRCWTTFGMDANGDKVAKNHRIELNPALLNAEEDMIRVLKDTLAHELCHTCLGCQNHGQQFHKVANIITKNLGYYIDTKADVDASEYFRRLLPPAKYKLVCTKCGNETPIARISDAVKNPVGYTCSKCGGNLDSYILNSKTGDYELFRGHNEEKQYPYVIKCTDCDLSIPFKRREKKYKDFIEYLYKFGSMDCPKCHTGSLYAVDNGTVITNASMKDTYSGDISPKERKEIEKVMAACGIKI